MISKCFNYETDAARALAKGDNVLRVSYHHPFMRANIYILRKSGNQSPLILTQSYYPPQKIDIFSLQKAPFTSGRFYKLACSIYGTRGAKTSRQNRNATFHGKLIYRTYHHNNDLSRTLKWYLLRSLQIAMQCTARSSRTCIR